MANRSHLQLLQPSTVRRRLRPQLAVGRDHSDTDESDTEPFSTAGILLNRTKVLAILLCTHIATIGRCLLSKKHRTVREDICVGDQGAPSSGQIFQFACQFRSSTHRWLQPMSSRRGQSLFVRIPCQRQNSHALEYYILCFERFSSHNYAMIGERFRQSVM